MKRLTGRNEYGGIISLISVTHKDVVFVKFLHALAHYEDTGFTPDEIVALKAERDAAVEDNNQTKDENTKWGEYIALLNSMLDKRDAKIAELRTRLEKSVELPCKCGDIFYWADFSENEVLQIEVHHITVCKTNKGVSHERSFTIAEGIYKGCYTAIDDKDVFITREDAEKALKEREAK